MMKQIYRKLERILSKYFVVVIIPCIVLSAFLFGFVGIKGVPIPVIYNLAGGDDPVVEETIVPVETSTVVIETISPIITEEIPSIKEPAPKYAIVKSEFDSGIRDMGTPFKFYRENVSGYKDILVSYEVYDYKILSTGYEWRSEELQRYFYNLAPVGYDYLIVFVRAEMDEYVSGNSMHLFDSSNFKIQINNEVITEDDVYQKNIRIKELEETYNKNHDYGTRPYGYDWVHVPVGIEISDASIDNGVVANKNGGIVAYPRFYLKSGKSNSEDGYIIYAIPEDREDILVLCNFASFGNAAWILT